MTKAVAVGSVPRHTEAELTSLEADLKRDQGWLSDQSAKQDKLAYAEDPVLLSSELDRKGLALKRVVDKLRKKKQPRYKPPPVVPSESVESSTATSSAASEPSEQVKEEPKAMHDKPKHEEL